MDDEGIALKIILEIARERGETPQQVAREIADYFMAKAAERERREKMKPQEGPPVSKLPAEAPKVCGFCSSPLETVSHEDFTAFTRYPPYAVICGKCIRKLETLRHLRDAYAVHYLKQSWDGHHRAIEKALFKEDVPVHATRLMVDLALKLSRRSALIFAGEIMISAPPRIVLVGRHAAACGKLLEAASSVTGMPLAQARPDCMAAARSELNQKCNDDTLMIPHGILFVHGYCESDHPGPVVYACETAEGLPPELETVNVDGYDLDPDDIR